MKMNVKTLVTMVFVGVAAFGATAQTMSIPSNGNIIFNHSSSQTLLNNSWGDLHLDNTGTGSNYGWLNTNRANVNGWVYANGVSVSGNLTVTGTKNFIHPHPTDESKVIKYIAVESGDALTLARGIAKTVNGEAIVALPEHFSLTTSKNVPVTVTLTPKGAPVLLYAKQDSKEKIVVAMKKSDLTAFGDVEFTFLVTGVRDGFEKQDVIVGVDKLYAPAQVEQNDVQKRITALNEKTKAARTKK